MPEEIQNHLYIIEGGRLYAVETLCNVLITYYDSKSDILTWAVAYCFTLAKEYVFHDGNIGIGYLWRAIPCVQFEGVFSDTNVKLVAERIDLAVRLTPTVECYFIVTKNYRYDLSGACLASLFDPSTAA